MDEIKNSSECCDYCFKWGEKYGDYKWPCNNTKCICHNGRCSIDCAIDDSGHRQSCPNNFPITMTDKNWEKEFDNKSSRGEFGAHFRYEEVDWDEIKLFITQLLERQTRCQKTIEGDAICGVKLDCHLHDWRANI